MMNRSDRDNLLQALTTTKQRIEQIARTLFLRKVPAAAQTLQELCDIIDKALSKEHAALYTEPLLSLIAVMQGFEKQKMPIRERVEALSLMGDIIDGVRSRLAEETEIKKEIYFLPYKASMWDSLESIWRAAVKDTENCNAHVVPIPYADRNPDGSAAQWHCERGIFPADVPVENWEDVDMKAIHPDVIYIHNPYDGMNLVTSVDSSYYSDKLKQYTDDLIYVPYFVSGEAVGEHFCQAPGVVNADHVIVQDENIKAQYEKYYPGGNPPEGKFLALGSPKFDRVRSKKKEDYILPKKWQKIIKGKKIILYNTSLGATLQNTDKVCAKLRHVFGVFKDRKDCALWWRPHPLMKATLRSMRPEVADEYEKIEKEYIAAGWGIYDDDPDVDRAIVCTDAYYGDYSSVVELYKVVGKSIMIQSIPLTE